MRKSKFSSIIMGFTLAAVLFTTACGGGKTSSTSESSGGNEQPIEVVETTKKEPLPNALHKVYKTDKGRVLVKNAGTDQATTEYKILVPDDLEKQKAANMISVFLQMDSGAQFDVAIYDSGDMSFKFDENSKYIAVGCTELFDKVGLEMPEDDLKYSGYYIKSYGQSVFIEAPRAYGFQTGAIGFLKAVVGYDMLDEDCVVFENDGSYLPDLEVIEAPDFDFRNWTNWMTTTKLYRMGYSQNYSSIIDTNGSSMHNCLEYLPTSLYLNPSDPENYHPAWYSENGRYRQLCYTAHGDAEEYEKMQLACLDVIKEAVAADLNREIVTLTQEDYAFRCECPACSAVVEKDGSISATLIRFMNDLEDKISAYMKEIGDDRQIVLCFFAYHTSLNAPTTPVSEDPSLKLNDNVCVIIAPISAKYTIPLDEGVNEPFAENFERWGEYATKIMAWVYECNYHHYLYPYNSYSSMVDTYYFLKKNNTFFIYNEGQRKNKNVPCFGKFKEYLCAKAQFDVTVDYRDLEKKFFENYFLDAAQPMKDLYDQITAWETNIETDPSYGLDGGIYEEYADEKFWPKMLTESWLKLIDEAYEKIAHFELEDPTLYKKLVKRIKIESIFMRYLECTLYAYSYSPEELKEIRTSFCNDCIELDIFDYREHDGDMSVIFAGWGL
ncbi:MAG: DUF4838 domain-containing protein [Clostridia bacterium]|nr:DUF4838 domain-containing protein [Clostridia bacterium]